MTRSTGKDAEHGGGSGARPVQSADDDELQGSHQGRREKTRRAPPCLLPLWRTCHQGWLPGEIRALNGSRRGGRHAVGGLCALHLPHASAFFHRLRSAGSRSASTRRTGLILRYCLTTASARGPTTRCTGRVRQASKTSAGQRTGGRVTLPGMRPTRLRQGLRQKVPVSNARIAAPKPVLFLSA